MAALSASNTPRLLELRHLRPADLDAVLNEEVLAWRRLLDWDFQASADLVRRFLGMQALNGFALIAGSALVGYTYYIGEERKGLIGDLYVLERFRDAGNQLQLLSAAVEALMGAPYAQRIECQLMMFSAMDPASLPAAELSRAHERLFMVAALGDAAAYPPGKARSVAGIENWSEQHHEDAAQLIATAYRGHIDSQINDQYRSVGGARRFLSNIVQYPGCGRFYRPASFVARQHSTGRVCGVSLASLVSLDVGHITQICVVPWLKATGIGYELLRRSLEALQAHGCRKVSLTVTAANRDAVRLYERMGFVTIRQFPAFVWEGF